MALEERDEALGPQAAAPRGRDAELAETEARREAEDAAPGEAEARREARAVGLDLVCGPGGLTLTDGTMELCPDFSDELRRIRPGALGRELLVRAARVRGTQVPVVADATAGLGEDSFLLAAAGFEVLLFERDSVIAALLADALARGSEDSRVADVVGRMRLAGSDSVAALPALAGQVDVVYLDPMFPERRKSAATKKKFQLLHHLERPCSDEAELLAAARTACPKKVVVKRPAKGPWLAGAKPSYDLAGKTVRYDVYLPRR